MGRKAVQAAEPPIIRAGTKTNDVWACSNLTCRDCNGVVVVFGAFYYCVNQLTICMGVLEEWVRDGPPLGRVNGQWSYKWKGEIVHAEFDPHIFEEPLTIERWAIRRLRGATVKYTIIVPAAASYSQALSPGGWSV